MLEFSIICATLATMSPYQSTSTENSEQRTVVIYHHILQTMYTSKIKWSSQQPA